MKVKSQKTFATMCALLMTVMIFQNVSAEEYDSGEDMDIFIDSFGNEHQVWRELINGTCQVFYGYQIEDTVYNANTITYANQDINNNINFNDGYLTIQNSQVNGNIKIIQGNVLLQDCNISGNVKIDLGRIRIINCIINGNLETKNADLEMRYSHLNGNVNGKLSSYEDISEIITGNEINGDVKIKGGTCYIVGNTINGNFNVDDPTIIQLVIDNDVNGNIKLNDNTTGFDGYQITNSTMDVLYPHCAVDPITGLGYVLWLENESDIYYIGTEDFITWSNPELIGSLITIGNPELILAALNGTITISWKNGGLITLQTDMDGDFIQDADDEQPLEYNFTPGNSTFIPDAVSVNVSLGISVAIDYLDNTTVKPDISYADLPIPGAGIGICVNITTECNQPFSAYIKFKYDDSALPINITEKYLRAYWHSNGGWIILKNVSAEEDTGIDTENNIVWAKTNHFSSFIIADSSFFDSDVDDLTDASEINADYSPDTEIEAFSDGETVKSIDFTSTNQVALHLNVPKPIAGIERANNAVINIQTSKKLYGFDEKAIQTGNLNSRIGLPTIYEDKIVYMDDRNGNEDIYLYDLGQNTETQITNDPSYDGSPQIWGDYIFWYRTMTHLYLKNYVTGEEWQIGDGYAGEIYGHYVVMPGAIYDINTRTFKGIGGGGTPHIFGNYVTYANHQTNDIMLYQIDTEELTAIELGEIDPFLLDIGENYIIYQDLISNDLYSYNINTPEIKPITENSLREDDPTIYGSFALWTDSRNGNMDIYGYDLVNNIEFPVCVAEGVQEDPKIYGDSIVWSDARIDGVPRLYYATLAAPCLSLAIGSEIAFTIEFTGGPSTTTSPDFSVALNRYISEQSNTGILSIPLTFSCNAKGTISFSNLDIDMFVSLTDPVNPDTDDDLLWDGEEYNWGTNPNSKDYDSDGLTDGEEVLLYECSPTTQYTDGDLLSDYDEVCLYKTKPNIPDTDGDSLSDSAEINSPEQITYKSKQIGLAINPATPTIARAYIRNVGTSDQILTPILEFIIEGISNYQAHFGYLVADVLTQSIILTPGTYNLFTCGYTDEQLSSGYDWCLEIQSDDSREGLLSAFSMALNEHQIFISPDISMTISQIIPSMAELHFNNLIVNDGYLSAVIEIQIISISDFQMVLGYIGCSDSEQQTISNGITDLTDLYPPSIFQTSHTWFVNIISYDLSIGQVDQCEMRFHQEKLFISPNEGSNVPSVGISKVTIPNVITSISSNMIVILTLDIISITTYTIRIYYDDLAFQSKSIEEGQTNLISIGYSPSLFTQLHTWSIVITPQFVGLQGILAICRMDITGDQTFHCAEIGTPVPSATQIESIATIHNVLFPDTVLSADMNIELSGVGTAHIESYYLLPDGTPQDIKVITEGTIDLLSLGYNPVLFGQGYDWQVKIINIEKTARNLEIFNININCEQVFASNDIDMVISPQTPSETTIWMQNPEAKGFIHNMKANVIISGDSFNKIYLGYYLGANLEYQMEIYEGLNDLPSLGYPISRGYQNTFEAGFYYWKLQIFYYGSTVATLNTFEIVMDQSTSPILWDTDGDNLDDAMELNSVVPISAFFEDYDGDSLSDEFEKYHQYESKNRDNEEQFITSGTSSLASCGYDAYLTNWDVIKDDFNAESPNWHDGFFTSSYHTNAYVRVENSALQMSCEYFDYVTLQEDFFYYSVDTWPGQSNMWTILCAIRPVCIASSSTGAHYQIQVRTLTHSATLEIYNDKIAMWSPEGPLIDYYLGFTLNPGQIYHIRIVVDQTSGTAKVIIGLSPYHSPSDFNRVFRIPSIGGNKNLWIAAHKGTSSLIQMEMDYFYLCNGVGIVYNDFIIHHVIVKGFIDEASLIIQTNTDKIIIQDLICCKISDGSTARSYVTSNNLRDLQFTDAHFTTASDWYLRCYYNSADVGWTLNTFNIRFKCRTDQYIADTDGGGINDGTEYNNGDNPTYPGDEVDSDGDGIKDGDERYTLPDDPDTDNDGFIDGLDKDPIVDLSVTVKISEILALDDVDSDVMGSHNPADFYLWIHCIDSQAPQAQKIPSSQDYLQEDADFISPNAAVTFDVADDSDCVGFMIALFDFDPSDPDDPCDISPRTGGGGGDPSLWGNSALLLNYDLKTGQWSGEDNIQDANGYGHASGNEDGSENPDTDQNDCELWFDITQNDIDDDEVTYWEEINVYKSNPTSDASPGWVGYFVDSRIYDDLISSSSSFNKYLRRIEQHADRKTQKIEIDVATTDKFQLKNIIIDEYNKGMRGVVFIGQFPYAIYYKPNAPPGCPQYVPLESYYQYIDVIWGDSNNDGYYDYVASDPDSFNRYLWTSHLKPVDNNVDLIEDYFTRAIDYMNEYEPGNNKAILVSSTALPSVNLFHRENIQTIYDDVLINDNIGNDTFNSYWTSGVEYEWFYIQDHGQPSNFMIFNGKGYYTDNPCPSQFVWLDPCYSGFYSIDESIASRILFGGRCLGTFASTYTGPILSGYTKDLDGKTCFQYINQPVRNILNHEIKGYSIYYALEHIICYNRVASFTIYYGDPLLKTWR